MVLFGRATYAQWSGIVLDLIDIDSGGLNVTTEAIPIPKYGTSVIEYAPGYTDYGSLSVTIGTDSDANITALRRAHEYNTVGALLFVLANGLEITANAFITNFGDAVEKHGLYTVKITFKLAGKTTLSAPTGTEFHIMPPANSQFFRGGSYTLSLSGNEAYAMAGGNAQFQVVDPETHPKIKIEGNLLIIDSDAPTEGFSVKAIVTPLGTEPHAIDPVAYTVVAPIPATISINGADSILIPPNAGTTSQYTILVYPDGSDTQTSWELAKYDTAQQKWVLVTEGDHIAINGTGKISIDADYTDTNAKPFRITATSIANPSLIVHKQITVRKSP